MKILFLGDISLNNRFIEVIENGENPFLNISSVFEGNDLVVGNLECLEKSLEGENFLKKPRLYTKKNTLKILNKIEVNLVGLANNHIYDNLDSGLKSTLNTLRDLGIKTMGVTSSSDSNLKLHYTDIHNIVILNAVTNDTNPSILSDSAYFLNLFNENILISEIEKFKKENKFVILYLHWGGKNEGAYFPSWQQCRVAHKLIDSGADLIIGHHSHTIQPIEKYKGKWIYYSLGNFAFDNVISDGQIKFLDKRSKEGLCVLVEIDNKILTCRNIYIEQNKNLEYNFSLSAKKKSNLRSFIFNNSYIKKKVFLYLHYNFFIFTNPFRIFFLVDKRNIIDKILNIKFRKLRRFIKRIKLTFTI